MCNARERLSSIAIAQVHARAMKNVLLISLSISFLILSVITLIYLKKLHHSPKTSTFKWIFSIRLLFLAKSVLYLCFHIFYQQIDTEKKNLFFIFH